MQPRKSDLGQHGGSQTDLAQRVWEKIGPALSSTVGPEMGQVAAEIYRRALAAAALEVLPILFPAHGREDIESWASTERTDEYPEGSGPFGF